MDWTEHETLNSYRQVRAKASPLGLCLSAVKYGSDKGGRGRRIGMIKAMGSIVSLPCLYQPIGRFEALIGFRARTKAASPRNCGGRAENTYLPI